MSEKYNTQGKVIIMTLGESSVGKTSFINKYVENTFNNLMTSTIGIEYHSKKITLPTGEEIEITIYDTPGQEQYNTITASVIRSAEGILLIYDITKQKTFDKLNKWFNKIREIKGEDFPMVLIGNKCDLEEHRVIYRDEGEKLARENEIQFFETSCVDRTNIENSILILTYEIIEKQKKERLKALEEEEKEKKEGKVINQSKIKFKLKNKKENKKEKKKHCC